MTTERASQLRVLGLVMLPIALFLERGVYYQFRAAFFLRAMDAGATPKEIGAVMSAGVWVGIAGYVLGGLASLARGHLSVLIGLGLSLLGYLLMAVAPSGWATAEIFVRLGSGCAILGFYAAMAGVGASLGHRVAGIALLQVAASVGGFLGPLGATASRISPWLVYVGLLPVVLAMLLLAVDWWMATTWERTQRPTEPPVNWGHAFAVAGVMILGGVLSAPIESATSTALFDVLGRGSGSSGMFVLASLVTIGGALIAAIAMGLAGLLAPRAIQPAPVVGSGLLCAGLGGGIGVAGSAVGITAALWLASLFAGLGTAVADALLLALLMGAFSRRWVGLGLLVYFSATRGVAGIFYAIGSVSPDLGVVIGGLSSGLALLLGVVALLLSKPLSAWLLRAPEDEPAGI